MLTLTENAAAVIRTLTTQPEVPAGSGLRIAVDRTVGALTLEIAATPAAGDAVLETGGARLFLDAEAVLVLEDKELDAAVDEQGSVEFAVSDQE